MPNEIAINRSIQIYILSNLAHNKVDVVNAELNKLGTTSGSYIDWAVQ